jgi:hypothetical protein
MYGNNDTYIANFETNKTGTFKKLGAREGYLADTLLTHTYTAPDTYYPVLSVTLDADLANSYIYDDASATYPATKIIDMPPTAGFITLSADSGYTPLEIEFSPKSTITGTYPIEKIVWDLGDGSPQLVATRHTTTPHPSSGFIYRPNYPTDPKDPRNYNVKHTYYRNLPTDQQLFYPSLTAYSANTLFSDSCSREIGPIGDRKKTNKSLLASYYYDTDNKAFIALDVEGKTIFLRKDSNYTKTSIKTNPTIVEPPNKVVYFNEFGTIYTGNTGLDIKNILNNIT